LFLDWRIVTQDCQVPAIASRRRRIPPPGGLVQNVTLNAACGSQQHLRADAATTLPHRDPRQDLAMNFGLVADPPGRRCGSPSTRPSIWISPVELSVPLIVMSALMIGARQVRAGWRGWRGRWEAQEGRLLC
jgi:hypothetical protein